jgi:hypothetical protein
MAFFACGSVEEDVSFRRFGGFAAKTTEKDGSYRPADGCQLAIKVRLLFV